MAILLNFRAQCARARAMSRNIFPAHCLFSYLLSFFLFLCSFTEITVTLRQSLFVLELRQLFYGHLAIQSKKLPNCLKRQNDRSGTSDHKVKAGFHMIADDRESQIVDRRKFCDRLRSYENPLLRSFAIVCDPAIVIADDRRR